MKKRPCSAGLVHLALLAELDVLVKAGYADVYREWYWPISKASPTSGGSITVAGLQKLGLILIF